MFWSASQGSHCRKETEKRSETLKHASVNITKVDGSFNSASKQNKCTSQTENPLEINGVIPLEI